MTPNSEIATVHVASGKDRFQRDQMMIWGLLPLSIKLSGNDTNGQTLMFEHRDLRKGGPPRHVHFAQDEWFYVIKGKFAFEIGGHTSVLGQGDTLFAPRGISHGWAHVGDESGTLLTLVSPVGDFEKFILDTTKHSSVPPQHEIEAAFLTHGMKVVGPPLDVS